MQQRWHKNPRECPHYNENVCPTCDFDDYYAENSPDCPWYTGDRQIELPSPAVMAALLDPFVEAADSNPERRGNGCQIYSQACGNDCQDYSQAGE